MTRRLLIPILAAASLAACAPRHHSVTETRYAGTEIRFRFDSSRVERGAEPGLRIALAFLKSRAETVVILEGMTDAAGASEYNRELGDRRAHAAKAWLLAQGVDPDRVVTVSYGEEGGEGRPARERRRVVIRDASE